MYLLADCNCQLDRAFEVRSDTILFSEMPSTMGTKTFSKSIELPETEVFRNLKNAKRFAMDIGKIILSIFFGFKLHIYAVDFYL